MANCDICTKATAVSLYIRVKPLLFENGKLRGGKKDTHYFFGYWPPDSHLAEYFRLELQRGQSILQPLFENNCRGHSLDEIIEAIEQKCPPIQGVPIRMLWNPSPKVTQYLLAETEKQRREAMIDINGDLRSVTCFSKEAVRTSILDLLNNAKDRTEQLISFPNHASMRH